MKNMSINNICLCGDGWGAKAALNGISLRFQNIIVVSNDKTLIKMALTKGFCVANSIFEVDADIYVCSGFTTILDKNFLDANRVLNIHYSILPRYRGLHSTVWSILNNEPYFGLTVHLMNEFIDDGPILYQYKFKNTGQNSREVIETCNDHIAKYLSQILIDYVTSKIKLAPQDRSQASWVCKRNLDDCLIDFDKQIDFLSLFFKALVDPYPLPRIKTNKGIVEIVQSELFQSDFYMTNGRVVNVELEKVWIKIANGFLIVNEIRDCNTKSVLSINDVFKLGMRLK